MLSRIYLLGFPGGSDGWESTCNAEDLEPIPGLGRSPKTGNGYPLQYSWLENSMDRGACVGYSPWGCKKLDMTLWLTYTGCIFYLLPRWFSGKESVCQELWETWVWSLGQKDPWRRNGNPLQYSCLGNPMNREAWRATVHGVAKESDTA